MYLFIEISIERNILVICWPEIKFRTTSDVHYIHRSYEELKATFKPHASASDTKAASYLYFTQQSTPFYTSLHQPSHTLNKLRS